MGPIIVQYQLRHTIAKVTSEGIINPLVVTNSAEANLEFVRMHERLFTRTFPLSPQTCRSDYFRPLLPCHGGVFCSDDTFAAAVWRRHTFSAAVDLILEIMQLIFEQNIPSLAVLLPESVQDSLGTHGVLEDTFKFSRLLHSAAAGAGLVD